MRSFVIVGLKTLIAMICIFLAFIVWASIFDGYPWREQFFWLLLIACTPLILRVAIQLLEAGRRAGAVLGLACVLLGPTPMFMEATWIWSVVLSIPLLIVWWQLGETNNAASPSSASSKVS